VPLAAERPLRDTMLPTPESEALGFYLSPATRSQIEAITPACWKPFQASTLRLLSPDSQATRQFLQHAGVTLPPAVEFVDSDARIDWATDSAAATSIVPMHWIRDLLDHLAETPMRETTLILRPAGRFAGYRDLCSNAAASPPPSACCCSTPGSSTGSGAPCERQTRPRPRR
jgi:hypothetical protein